MKKAGFKLYFIVYLLALIISTGCITLLKLFSTDPNTGFINTGNFPYDNVLLIVYRVVILVAILFWFVVTIIRRSYHDYPVSYRHIPSSIFAILSGLSMIAYSILIVPTQLTKTISYTALNQGIILKNKLLVGAGVFFGVMGGISLIVGGIRPKYGVAGKPGAMLGFFPALWQLLLLLARFNSFIAGTTINDVLMVILFMCFASVFLIGQSRIIFGLGIRDGKTYAIPAGLSTSLIGISFCVSTLISWIYYGVPIVNVAISLVEFAYIFFLSVYSAVFVFGYSRSIKIV